MSYELLHCVLVSYYVVLRIPKGMGLAWNFVYEEWHTNFNSIAGGVGHHADFIAEFVDCACGEER